MPNPSELERLHATDGTDLERCRVEPAKRSCEHDAVYTDQLASGESYCRVCWREGRYAKRWPHNVEPIHVGPQPVCIHCGDEYGFHSGDCPNRPPFRMGHARVDRRTGLPIPEHPAVSSSVSEELRKISAMGAAERRQEPPTWEVTEAALRARIAELEAENVRLRLQRHDENTYALALSAGPSPERQRIAELEVLAANLSDRLAACSECLGRAAERRAAYATVTLIHDYVPPPLDEIEQYAGEQT